MFVSLGGGDKKASQWVNLSVKPFFFCSFSFPQSLFLQQCAAAQLILEKTKNNSVVCETEREEWRTLCMVSTFEYMYICIHRRNIKILGMHSNEGIFHTIIFDSFFIGTFDNSIIMGHYIACKIIISPLNLYLCNHVFYFSTGWYFSVFIK